MSCAIEDLPAEFVAVSPAVAQQWIDFAHAEIDATVWACKGVDPEQGCKMLTSHYLKLVGEGTSKATKPGAGSVTAESRGVKSVSVAASSAATGPHGSTIYGQAYDRLLARVTGSLLRHTPPPPQPA